MARRLVLNGLTAEVHDGGEDNQQPRNVDNEEFYHELELYHQLLALPVVSPKDELGNDSDPNDINDNFNVTGPANVLPVSTNKIKVKSSQKILTKIAPTIATISANVATICVSTAPSAAYDASVCNHKSIPVSKSKEVIANSDPTPLLTQIASCLSNSCGGAHNEPGKDKVGELARVVDPATGAGGAGGGNDNEFCTEYPAEHVRPALYLGSFPARGSGRHCIDTNSILLAKDVGKAVPVFVIVAISGVKVCDRESQSVRMFHALRRISFASCEAARALFAFVAREPSATPPARESASATPPATAHADTQPPPAPPPARHYCHAFQTNTPDQATELNTLVGDAFRMAFASQLHPSAPIWGSELSGGGERSMGVTARAPDSLPGLTRQYPHCLTNCESDGSPASEPSPSPSSSEEWCGLRGAGGSYRRLGGERAPLMRRLAAALLPSDDDSTPLVADTPTTPTNASTPLCLSGGYINEASEAEARTRQSNRDTPRRQQNHRDDRIELNKCNTVHNNGSTRTCSASSSSGSSCGASACSGNNNPRLIAEPELRHAPWFQHGIPREIALEVLAGQGVGAFLVRGSTTQPSCYALSVRVPADFAAHGIAHYLIQRTAKGYKIKGFTKEFTSLSALVTHHSVMPELLPVPLRLARPVVNAPRVPRRDHADIDAVAPSHKTTSRHVTPFLTLDV